MQKIKHTLSRRSTRTRAMTRTAAVIGQAEAETLSRLILLDT